MCAQCQQYSHTGAVLVNSSKTFKLQQLLNFFLLLVALSVKPGKMHSFSNNSNTAVSHRLLAFEVLKDIHWCLIQQGLFIHICTLRNQPYLHENLLLVLSL